ncbi:MAG: FAD-dependent 5-carboxymethylaminomethyl-2-thiouridine(34) oxidoreductase MnmC, partial [Marinicaulis sp.]|nr:FAD-dependent 5-carboxymethylaminomethyl-2-thiouridine(34) oxidoreductase MnmC [Marinicaulis sp.]
VRRRLQSAGFEIEKRPGFGRKREMLAGRLREERGLTRRKPWYATHHSSPAKPGARVAVIGAGIAGASMAHALRQVGMTPIVLEAKTPASGASGNPAGMIMPRLDAGDTPDAHFHSAAYLYTAQLLSTLQEQASTRFFVECGAILHAQDERETIRQQKLIAMHALPDDWMRAHHDGLFFPKAGVVYPPAFVRALLGETPVHQCEVSQLRFVENLWRVGFTNGENETFDAVVIANGLDALRFAQCHSLPLAGAAGQIDFFPDAEMPEHARMFGAYIAPCPNFSGKGGGLVIGATYAPIEIGNQPTFTAEATQTNINAVRKVLPDLADTLDPQASIPRASIRCVTPDWMPIAGPIPNLGFYARAYDGIRDGRLIDYPAGQTLPGLYILSGLGSRGLVTAPLAAAVIAAEIAAAPSPVAHTVCEALHPARFFIRELRKAKPG